MSRLPRAFYYFFKFSEEKSLYKNNITEDEVLYRLCLLFHLREL